MIFIPPFRYIIFLQENRNEGIPILKYPSEAQKKKRDTFILGTVFHLQTAVQATCDQDFTSFCIMPR